MKICCISTVPTSALAEAMNELNEEFGLNVAFEIYYPNQINEAEVEEETVKNDLKESAIVLIDIRGGKSSEIAYDALKEWILLVGFCLSNL